MYYLLLLKNVLILISREKKHFDKSLFRVNMEVNRFYKYHFIESDT